MTCSLFLVFGSVAILGVISGPLRVGLGLPLFAPKQTSNCELLHCETAIRILAPSESCYLQTTFIGVTGHDDNCANLLPGRVFMPLNEIPKYLSPDTRRLIDAALEDASQEFHIDRLDDAHRARMKLATTMVALASVGETDPAKLKRFAIHALRGVLQADNAQKSASAA
jgi:hypothetical protein